MTDRQIRRAAERTARKQARKAEQQTAASTVSPAQLAANRENAKLSTGPTSETGKAKSSLNAVTTALTGRTVLLPSDDAARYERHVAAYVKELSPVGVQESALVQSLADTTWRLDRIPGLEMAIFAMGHTKFAEQFAHEDSSVQPRLIEMETFLVYEKQLRNLQIQEARLCRRREKEMAELRQLQQSRIAEEKLQLEDAAKLYTSAQHDGKSFDPADHGFEFSIEDIEGYIEGVHASILYRNSFKRAAA
jgi:hypothetical protein